MAAAGVTHVGCWAHVRRKFFEAKSVNKKAGSAEEALSRIATLFAVEKALRGQPDLTAERFVEERAKRLGPELEAFHGWLLEQ